MRRQGFHVVILSKCTSINSSPTEMAVTDDSPTPQMVGNAFVEQYYSILHQTPHLVHRFYHESSVLSRPEEDGSMTMVTTIEDINKKVLSVDYTSFRVEILSADAQLSYKDGVMVVVTGCLTGSDNLKRKFVQSFFLAPQEKVYFVLNDVFRYVDKLVDVDADPVPANDSNECVPTAAYSQPELSHVPENIPPNHTFVAETDTKVNKGVNQPLENKKLSQPLENKKVSQPVENKKASVTEKVGAANHVKESSLRNHLTSTDKIASNTQEDAPKKSFVSIVHALKDNDAPFNVRTFPPKPVEQPRASMRSASELSATSSDTTLKKKDENAGKAYAIFVANLPLTATVDQLEQVFRKFGPIKRNGIQVRSSKYQGSCFGFVEFESASSMQSALEASRVAPPLTLEGRRLYIEERRAATSNDRARYSSGPGGYRDDAGYRNDGGYRNNGGYRNDGGRGRGNFNSSQGYVRKDFEKRGEIYGRSRGNYGQYAGTVPSGYQNGGRGAQQLAEKY